MMKTILTNLIYKEPEEGKNAGLFDEAEEGGFSKPRDVREKEQEVIR